MFNFEKLRKSLRLVLFYGNNWTSLIGGAITSASAIVLVGFWVVSFFGRGGSSNPYLGILFDVFLPGLFIFGLILIPIGIWLRRRQLKALGQIPSVYPQINLKDPVFRRGIEIVIVATAINFVIVGTASYRTVSYMDSANFCGQSCHVMAPQWAAYQVSPHSHVACVECHIGAGFSAAVQAKVNGTKQLTEVTLGNYPRPILAPLSVLRPARATCEACHSPTRFVGEKLLVKSNFADDEQNTESQTVLVLHLGGEDSLSRLSGIHGVHLNHMEYIATSGDRSTIPWVQRENSDGSETVFASSALNGAMPQGERRTMDCIDCHNRASHTFYTPEEAINRAMADGSISTELPFVHKEGLELLKATYANQDDARAKIPAQLVAFYQTSNPAVLTTKTALVKAAGDELATLYSQNVFPDMKVTWGTHPNNIGHMSYPGCFRCHDGDHVSKAGKAITQDCANCHNLLAVEEAKPKVLSDLGL